MPSNDSTTTANINPVNNHDFTIDPDLFAFTPRRLRVVCIGAGFSGLTMAHKLKHERSLEYVDFVVYEKNNEVGGTWFENVYPGVGCDVPCHSYIFPFEPNPSWSKFYAGGAEIQKYILDTAAKYELKQKIVFNTELTRAVWDEDRGKWTLQLKQRDGTAIDDQADILINASGVLNQFKYPNIDGLNTFQGKLMHTAFWDPRYNWEGKRIAVIGNGSSALQVIPALQPKAARIVNYIRNATWVSMNICGNLTRDGMGTNFEYTNEEKKVFQENPGEFLRYRKEIQQSVNGVYKMMLSNSPENKSLFTLVDTVMRARLSQTPSLIDKLIPKYEVGCRRLSPADGYLEALQSENGGWCFDEIRRVTPAGILTDAGEEEFDLIVCATGFDTSFIPRWEMIGRDGRRLNEEWREKPEAYFSVCAGGMPNYFMFAGPNCPIGHGSVPQMLAWTADYMLDWVEKMAAEDIRSIVVRDSVVKDYNRFAAENLKRSVWSRGCPAWYSKRKEGETSTVTAMYPGSVLHYKEYLRTIRGEHFDIRYRTPNPFRYLGNGELALERSEGGDLAYYLQSPAFGH